MENLLLKKLHIKSGYAVAVLNAPENILSAFGEIPTDVTLKFDQVKDFNAVIAFVNSQAELTRLIKQQYNLITPETIFWIFYPKKSSKIKSDLNLMNTWQEDLGKYGLSPCASASLNQIWSGLRIKLAQSVKSSGLANADLKTSSFSEYIDVVSKKIIRLPEDFDHKLQKNAQAKDFFDQLSYSHKKEYILWILTAKQEKTRLSRLEKALSMLEERFKNP